MHSIFLKNRMRNLGRIASAACLCSALGAGPVQFHRGTDRIDVSVDGKPFTTYIYGPATAKPYLMPLRTASGVTVTRNFPIGNDASSESPKTPGFEPHQRPLYFAHGNVDGLDFWEEPVFDKYYTDHGHQAYGRMVLDKIEEVKESGDAGVIRARYRLEDPSGRTIAEETQSYRFQGTAGTRIVDCEFTVHATNGPVVFGDTKEGTFGIRLAPELSAPHDHMTNSNGAQGEKAIWGKPANWVNYSGTIGGKPLGIAVFDHPTSFHHPTTWHARAYGLFAANPFGLREFSKDPNKDGSWTVPEGESLKFRYRVLIYDGAFDPSRIEKDYQQYAAPN